MLTTREQFGIIAYRMPCRLHKELPLNYNKSDPQYYSDKSLRKRYISSHDELEKSYIDSEIEAAAQTIFSKYSDEPQFLSRVATTLAQKVLDKSPKRTIEDEY
jgi:hypothetical protein